MAALPDSFVVKNVNVWTVDGEQKNQDVFVEAGRVSALVASGTQSYPETIFDGQGKVLMPVGVDLQTHLRTPGQSEKETPLTGLRAALRGGYGAVLTMPNTKPIIDNPTVCELALREVREAERATGVKVYLSAAMTMGQDGFEVVDAKALAKAGVKALTDDGKGVASDDIMEKVFRAGAEAGLPLLQHAEVPGHGTALAPGPTQQALGLKPYLPQIEAQMIERDLRLLERVPTARYHVLHVSAKESLDVVAAYKNKGLKLTAEVTPHHLYFSSDDIPSDNTDFKMNPPIRGNVDRKALREALASGLIDCTSTDHAPHEKARKGPDFTASAFGTTGLETSLRVLIDMKQKGEISAARIVEVFSQFPAKFLGVDSEFGQLKVGFPFRAVWFDADRAPSPVQIDELESLSKNNCFVGTALAGKILGVFNDSGLFRF